MLHLSYASAACRLDQPKDAEAAIAAAGAIARQTIDSDYLGMNFSAPNVDFWQVSIDTDGGEAGRALARAQAINASAVSAPERRAHFYPYVALACTRTSGKDAHAVRYLIAAERVAPQHVHASDQAREVARTVLMRSERRSTWADAALRGLAERLGLTPPVRRHPR